KYMHNVKNKTISFMLISVMAGDINVPKIETDCVPTAAINQAPLIPSPKVGLFLRIVMEVKKVYMISTHKNMPIPQRMKGIMILFVTVYTWLPKTHVPATSVKKPGPVSWLLTSLDSLG